MKRKLNMSINEGFCASDPVPVELEFEDGATATFLMSAMSQNCLLYTSPSPRDRS